MSAQAYDKVYITNHVMTARDWQDLNNLPMGIRQNVILIPQSEYNSLLEWLDGQIEQTRNHGCRPDIDLAAPSYIKGHFEAYQKVKEKLTFLNTK